MAQRQVTAHVKGVVDTTCRVMLVVHKGVETNADAKIRVIPDPIRVMESRYNQLNAISTNI